MGMLEKVLSTHTIRMVPKTHLDVAVCFPVNIFLYQYNYTDNDNHLFLHKPLACIPYLTKATMSKFKLSKFLNGRNCSSIIIGKITQDSVANFR